MFRSAHAQSNDWKSATTECIAALGALPASDAGMTRLGMIYITEALAPRMGVIVEALRDGTGVADWVGAAGLGIAGDEEDFFDEAAIAIMVADFPEGSYQVLSSAEAVSRAGAARAGQSDAAAGFAGPPLLVLHADAGRADVVELIDKASAETQGYLIGGLTMSETARHQVAGVVTDSGLTGVMFEPEIGVVTSLSQGCAPIGELHTITRAVNNYIFELDGKPALDVLKDDVGDVLARDLRRAAGFIHAALPVTGSDTGDYVVRNLIGVDDSEGIVAIAETVEVGDRVMFVSRDANAAAKDFQSMLERLAARAAGKAKGALFISCIARGPNMFGGRGIELKMIRDAIGAVPLVGIYANGEISNSRLYGYTGVLTLFL
jgi:small ligand-binding sensory domain FIST